MKILKILLFIVVGIIGIVIILGLVAPKKYSVERSVSIEAPTGLVKDQIVRFENFKEWEPWGAADPNMKVTIEGEDGAVGAVYRWEGNDQVGSGTQEIINMTDDRVDIKLNFIAPWESEDFTYYEFNDQGESVEVTWGMDGTNPFPMNVMAMFMDIEGMIGNQYDKGLNQLKARCQNMAAEMKAEEAEMEKEAEATEETSG